MTKAIHSKFVLCIHPGDSEDLESRKVYQAIPDPRPPKKATSA